MGNVMFRDRQRRILRYLNGNQVCMTGQALSKRLGVTARTVRSDIVEINRCIDPAVAKITAYRGKGYQLDIYNRAKFHDYISGNVALLTREDRTQYLLVRLLWAEKPLQLNQLEDEMYISRTTLESDIRALQNTWVTEHLQFLRHRDTLHIVQNEVEIRVAFLRLYSENIDFNSRSGIVSAGGTLNLERLSVLRADLFQLLRHYGITLDDFSFFYFALANWLSSFRSGKLAPVSPAQMPPLQAIIVDIGKLFSGKYQITLPLSELCWLQNILEDLQRQYHPAVEQAVQTAIAAALSHFRAPFLSSERITTELRNFARDCIGRMAFPRFESQDLLLELGAANPSLAQLSHFLTQQVLQALSLTDITVDTLRLVPSLISAKNRYIARHIETQPVALLACHLSDSIASYLYERLSQHFTNRIRIQGVYPIHDQSTLENTNYDFLITTVDITELRDLTVPAVTISPHLTPEDFAAINQMAHTIQQEKYFP